MPAHIGLGQIQGRPDHQRDRRSHEGIGEGEDRRAIGCQGASAIEAEPAEPEQTRPQESEGNVVGQDGMPGEVLSGADHERRHFNHRNKTGPAAARHIRIDHGHDAFVF